MKKSCSVSRWKHRFLDAFMRTDSILVMALYSEGKTGFAYLCDEDIVLVRWENRWIPVNESEAARAKDHLSYWSDSFSVMIRKEDDEYDY